MPLNKNIKKAMVIGSGPIIIGQAAEFDYAGTQACRVLREDGIEIVLVNSNPATIMTDNDIADHIYIEPLNLATIKRIISKERPDSILSGLGGQTGLTLSMQLSKEGFLNRMGVQLLGSLPETIDKAEDRQIFKDTMIGIGQPVIPSVITTGVEQSVVFANEIGYPVIIRPAFTLGGTGGGIAYNETQLRDIAINGISMSPIGQILVEKSIAGWKEIEFEVMRDKMGNTNIVCSMENLDPVGVHTGDSIVIAPTITLSDREFQMLRSASLKIVQALKVEGGCNVQLALNPHSFEYAVIEVNPRVSRSSALASKATGYPIAKVATKIAIGYTLDEIVNSVTGTTYAAFEPTLDYVAVKLPKWPFDKFIYAQKELGTQMKATGEVMAIADNFEEALLKAVRGAELGMETLDLPRLLDKSIEDIREMLNTVTDQRIFVLYEAIKRGLTIDELNEITKVDRWFLNGLKNIYDKSQNPTNVGLSKAQNLKYKMVDTCGGEFEARTPYFYSVTNAEENEVIPFIERNDSPKIIVLGSGPIRIGQGIEFDYASVHCVWTLKELGYEVIVVNNNPETVSTDFDTGDRLYFEPLNIDDVMSIIDVEKPVGVITAFGGGTAIKLARPLHDNGVKIIGTPAESIDICEDRAKFDELLENLGIKRPKGRTVKTAEEAVAAAQELDYPVLLRPSYVLGGQNMIIAFTEDDVREYMKIILRTNPENPVLIDQYISGLELEVDAICDGEDILIPGIIEHIERTGVHSGDSIAVYPTINISDTISSEIFVITKKLCNELQVRGLVNIQYVLHQKELYVIEVNPRASRTVPYISKITGIPMCKLATKTAVGMTLSELGVPPRIAPVPPYFAVKVPVFSFEKLVGLDTILGPEMKSTGEVLGIGKDFREALYKGLAAAGYKLKRDGGVLITVKDEDKMEIIPLIEKFVALGFEIYATKGTAEVLTKRAFSNIKTVSKIALNDKDNTATLLESGVISYVVCTSSKGRDPALDEVKMRRKACALGIPCLTSIDTANALADSLLSGYNLHNMELMDINNLRTSRLRLPFTKMHSCRNDYIYINCFETDIESPESLPILLSDRQTGIGASGVVLILPSEVADAKMRIFNHSGQEGGLHGNAIRCVAKYLCDNWMAKGPKIKIETDSDIKEVIVSTSHGLVVSATVNMGNVIYGSSKNILDYTLHLGTLGVSFAVVFCEDLDHFDTITVGNHIMEQKIGRDYLVFTEVADRNHLKLKICDNNCNNSSETPMDGEIQANAACVAAMIATTLEHCDKNEDIKIQLVAGELIINCTENAVFMTGDCAKVFDGVVEV
ncbi:MAG: carbamoyl-phosphate synthase large subunit [Firmicutes bacterium]|nr:carbamoyl-phosphate synthase large subunit [Bacillota bacterium]